MDAVKFIKEKERMCGTLSSCGGCPVIEMCNPSYGTAEEAVAAVEKWSEEHPVATNGQKVQELIPYTALLRSWASAIGNEPLDDSDVVKLVIPRDWWDAEYKEE